METEQPNPVDPPDEPEESTGTATSPADPPDTQGGGGSTIESDI